MRVYEAILKPYPLFLLLFLVAPTVFYLECEAAELRLTWLDNSTDEDGFNIDRKTGMTGIYTPIASVGADTTTFTDSGLLNDTEYCYRVYAFNAAAISPFSEEACGATPPAAAFVNSVSVNIADGTVLGGTSVVWTATPSGVPTRVEFFIDGMLRWTEYRSNYQFNGNPAGTLDTTTLSNGSHELTVRAVYADGSVAEKIVVVTVSNSGIQQFVVMVNKEGVGSGKITSDPAGLDCGISCIASFISGTVVTLTPIAAAGSVFAGWNDSRCASFTIAGDVTCNAIFIPVANTISTNIPDAAVLSGASVLWTATPTGIPARVQFFIDGMLRWTEYRSIYQFNGTPTGTLDTLTLNNGFHELKVRAEYSDGSIAEKIVGVTVLYSSGQPLAAKIGIFRPSTGEWFLDLDGNGSFDGCAIDICLANFGASGMRPVVGDWYGTGRTNIGVYEPQTGIWHLDDGNDTWDDCESGLDLCIASFGAPGSYPVVKTLSDTDQIVIGFFQRTATELVDGETVTKLGLWKFDIDGNGILDSCEIDRCIENFGQPGDLPVVGNWDGAGDRIGIFRPQSGEWFIDLNDNGSWDGSPIDRLLASFGQSGDRPVAGDWDATGVVRIGIFRPSTGEWFLDKNGNGQFDDCSVDACLGPFGQSGDRPIVGNW